MKILAAARHPSPGEAIAAVAKELGGRNHGVELVGVGAPQPEFRKVGGSADIFRRAGLDFTDVFDLWPEIDPLHIPDSSVDALLKRSVPDRVVVGCSPEETGSTYDIEDALLRAARRWSIRTIQVVEWWDSWYPRGDGTLADAYAALDRMTAGVLMSRGVPAERITVTGSPGLDGYAYLGVTDRDARRHELGLEGERLLAFYGQAPYPNGAPDSPTTLEWTVRAMRDNDRMVFCPHPRDTREYGAILAIGGERVLRTSMTSDQMLSAADLELSHYSTMGLKADLLGIPTINFLLDDDFLDLKRLCGGFPLELVGASGPEVGSYGALVGALAGPFPKPNRSARRELSVDGLAAHRVADLLCA